MQRRTAYLLLALLTCCCLATLAQQQPAPAPKLTTVTPETGKADTEFAVAGENLDNRQVAELLLTDGKSDLKAAITAQAAASIKFKAPSSIKPGRYGLMILTADRQRLIEQPVKVTIE